MNYISEYCRKCGREMKSIKIIYVEIDTDDYVCVKCANKYNLKVVPAIPQGGVDIEY